MKKLFSCLFCVIVCTLSLGAYAAELTLHAPSQDHTNAVKSTKTKKITVENLTVEALVQGLSQWTGLNFRINDFTLDDKKISIDWSLQSSLISGAPIDNKEFAFANTDALRWFMLDCLHASLLENFELDSVFYTQDGGKVLLFEKLSPVKEFPLNEAYKGSHFYFLAHKQQTALKDMPAPTVIDDAVLFERTKGRWRLQSKDNPVALIVMDGLGGFSTYTLIGTLKTKGYLELKYHNNQSTYEMYGLDKKFIDSFTIRNGKEFQLGKEGMFIYIKEK